MLRYIYGLIFGLLMVGLASYTYDRNSNKEISVELYQSLEYIKNKKYNDTPNLYSLLKFTGRGSYIDVYLDGPNWDSIVYLIDSAMIDGVITNHEYEDIFKLADKYYKNNQHQFNVIKDKLK